MSRQRLDITLLVTSRNYELNISSIFVEENGWKNLEFNLYVVLITKLKINLLLKSLALILSKFRFC